MQGYSYDRRTTLVRKSLKLFLALSWIPVPKLN